MPVQDNLRDQYPGAYAERRVGIPDMIKEKYDAALKKTGKKLWAGAMQVAVSGFGKGVLFGAALFAIGAALSMGAAAPVFMTGAMEGLAIAAKFLLVTTPGLLTLAVAGTLGAVSDVRLHQSKISAEIARAEEMAYEREREAGKLAQSMQPQVSYSISPDGAMKDEHCGHCARELLRREAAANNTYRGI